MGILGIFVSLFLLMYLAYRGWSVIALAPILALLAAAMSGELPLMGTYTQIFMGAASAFIMKPTAFESLLGHIRSMISSASSRTDADSSYRPWAL